MLVLLVVFMVTAPLLTVGVEVDLPETDSKVLPGDDEPLTVSIDSEGGLFVQEHAVEAADLVAKLRAITGENADARIFVRGDRAIAYGRVMQVMALIADAGFRKVALVTRVPLGDDAS